MLDSHSAMPSSPSSAKGGESAWSIIVSELLITSFLHYVLLHELQSKYKIIFLQLMSQLAGLIFRNKVWLVFCCLIVDIDSFLRVYSGEVVYNFSIQSFYGLIQGDSVEWS